MNTFNKIHPNLKQKTTSQIVTFQQPEQNDESVDDGNLSSSIVSIDADVLNSEIDKEMTSSVITLDKSCLEKSHFGLPQTEEFDLDASNILVNANNNIIGSN